MEIIKMHEMFCNSLVSGFFQSNLTGQGLVLIQILASIVMLAYILGKYRQLNKMNAVSRKTTHSIMSGHGVLDYFLERHTACNCPIENIYLSTSDRLIRMFPSEIRNKIISRIPETDLAITTPQFELVKSQCEYALEEESIRIEYGMGVIATVVALSPMLGLLGTVLGMLGAFESIGAAGNFTTEAVGKPIWQALLTTAAGLTITIPCHVGYNYLVGRVESMILDMEKPVN
jgi:biopolymer transport protein ExbB/TolQ